MIFGIGTDIISLERIAKSLARNGDKFAQRILADSEYSAYQEKKTEKAQIAFLAKRFAAKEAISKALGTGMRNGIDFVQLVISNDELGKPFVELTGKAKEWAEQHNISTIQLTISDEQHYAVVFVVAEK
ncbi:MAG: holo-ACP synthase [Kangiellaceae bacterium]|nr:holo-ACP synthase [Kangiellaceae bacterium]